MNDADFSTALLQLLQETFVDGTGYYLDPGTSLFETLATISAAEASQPVGGRCATLAAQVAHTAFFLDVLEQSARAQQPQPADWEAIWRQVTAVSAPEWAAIQQGLRDSYARLTTLIRDTPAWPHPAQIGGAIAAVAHSAYHLGEIRQALCTLKQ